MAIGLCGLVMAQTTFRVPASSYKLSADKTGTFIDLSDLENTGWVLEDGMYTKDNLMIPGGNFIMTMGADLPVHQHLENLFFYYDEETNGTKSKTLEIKIEEGEERNDYGWPVRETNIPTETEQKLLAIPYGGKAGVVFMGKRMTGFTIGAGGSVLFTDQSHRISLGQYTYEAYDNPEEPQYQLPTYSGNMDMLTELVSIYPLLAGRWGNESVSSIVKGSSVPVRVGYVMAMTDKAMEQTMVVQFDYLVNYQEANEDNGIEGNAGDRWIYQFQIKDNEIKLVVKELSISNMPSGAGAIGFAAYQEGMGSSALGGNTTSYIAVGSFDDPVPCWENPAAITSVDQGCFQITGECAPQTGWTLAIGPLDACPETIQGLTAEEVTYGDGTDEVTATSNVISTSLTFNAKNFTVESAARSIVAVLSASQTPPTLENGNSYATGTKIGEAGEAEVFANTPISYYDYTSYGEGLEMEPMSLSALNLKPSTQYYIHLYTMAYQCEGAPMYSSCFKTLSAETGMGAPDVKISGATTEKVTLAIVQPKTYGTVLVKSDTLAAIALTGKVAVGDKVKIDDKEVGEVIAVLANSEKTFELTFDTPGAGAYIHAYTIDDVTAEAPVYAEDVLKLTAQTAFAQPIGLIDFSKYPSIEQRPDIYSGEYERPLMPFGWTAEAPLAAPQLPSSFAVEKGYNQIPNGLRAQEPFAFEFMEGSWIPVFEGFNPKPANVFVDAITPPFIAKATAVQAVYEVSFIDPTAMPMPDFYQFSANDLIVIEYSLNFGEWQEAKTFTGKDLEDATAKSHKLDVTFNCQPTDIVRVRYRFRSPNNIEHVITQAEFLDVRDCQTPADLIVVSDKLTNREATLTWNDKSTPVAQRFRIEYQEIQTESEAAWQTQTVNRATGHTAEAMEGLLEDLKTATNYNYRITAVCASGESHPSKAQIFATLHSLPFAEPLSGTYANNFGQEPKERGMLFYTNVDLGQPLKTPTAIGSGWKWGVPQHFDNKPERTALMCYNGDKNAWLVTPTIYIRELGYNFEQTFSFTLNTLRRKNEDDGGYSKEDGVKTTLEGVKLYVLMSKNGSFTIDDTLRTFALDQEGFNQATIELPVAVEGRVQFAFLYTSNGSYDDAQYECELSNLHFDYNETPCLPVENLRSTATRPNAISLSWQGEAMAYGIYWKQTSATEYNETPKVVTETEATVEGLTESTQYDFKVVGFCSEDHGTASEPVLLAGIFTTRSCHMPTDFKVEDITATGALFSSKTDQPNYMTKRLVYVTPKAGGETQIFEQTTDELSVDEVFTAQTAYTAQTRAVCSSDSSAMTEAKEFTTLAKDSFNLTLKATPENAGTVTGEGKYEEKSEVTIKATANENYKFVAWINGTDTLSTQASYTFPMPAQDVTYTAVFVKGTANEALLQASFTVGTKNGNLYVRNLNGIAVKDINVYGLTGNLVNRFTPNSREDLTLPIDAQRAILFVRLNTEKGVAVYKVYLQ